MTLRKIVSSALLCGGLYSGLCTLAGAQSPGRVHPGNVLGNPQVTEQNAQDSTLNSILTQAGAITFPSGINVTGFFTAAGLVTLADIATQASNTMLVNATNGVASPTAQAVPSCSGAGNALKWTTNTGIGCNSAITAAAVPISGIIALGTNVGTALGINLNASGGLLAETQVRNGDIIYNNGGVWSVFPGNNAGTQEFSENASGVPSWATPAGTGTVTNVAIGAGISSTRTASGSTAITSTGTLFIDASYLPGFIGGLLLSNDGGTPNSVIDIAAGAANDTTNSFIIKLGAFTKSTAGAWAANTGSNGMGNGLTIANATWYAVCLADNAGTADVYFDTSVTCANKPAGISGSNYRVLGFFKTNGSAQIIPGTWRAIGTSIEFDWTTVVTDVNTTVGTTATAFTLPSVPNGVSVNALIRGTITKAAALPSAIIYPTTETGTTAVATPAGNRNLSVQASGGTTSSEFNIPTNTSQQIEAVSDTAATTLAFVTHGYIYTR